MRNAFVKTLETLAKDNRDIFLVTGDAGFLVLDTFQREHPDRFVNSGIAEQNATGYAAGLAMAGFNVFVYNIIPFLLYRCFEQVRNDICYQQLPVTLVGIGSGVTYAPQGMTHYSVEDLALCLALPNLTVLSPADPVEVAAATRYAAEADGPVYIRIAKAGDPVLRAETACDILAPATLRPGDGVVVFAHGNVVAEAVTAWETCSAAGLPFRLVSVPAVQPLPVEGLLDLLAGCSTVMVLEEHCRSGGLADRVARLLVDKRLSLAFVPLTIPDGFIHLIKKQPGLRRHFGIDAEAVVQAVTRVAGGRP